MTQQALQISLITVCALVMMGAVLGLARTGRLSFRYTAGWIGFFVLSALLSFFVPFASPASSLIGVTPGVIVTFVAAVALLLICIQLSISISGLQEQVRRLAEEIALLQTRSRDDHT